MPHSVFRIRVPINMHRNLSRSDRQSRVALCLSEEQQESFPRSLLSRFRLRLRRRLAASPPLR